MNNFDSENSRRSGSAKTWILIGLICLLAILVPVGLYFISTVQFTNGTTSQNLSAPDTGVTPAMVAPAPVNNNAAARNQTMANANAQKNTKTIDLLVVDQKTKEPIAGLTVAAVAIKRSNGTTDANGHVRVPYPAGKVNYFSIHVTGRGYLPQRLDWADFPPERRGPIPATYTLQMGKSTKVSGKIIDDDGRPVAGATVALEFNMSSSDPHIQTDVMGYNRDKPIKTGEDGTWVFNGAPENCNEIRLMSWDNHHVVDDYWNAQPYTPVSKLYDGTATFTLHRGVAVEGTVQGPDGTPLAGANVVSGENANSYNGIPPQTTDASGKFSYVFAAGHHVILTANAKGYAPDMQDFTLGSDTHTVTFNLSKAHQLRGKVVNSAGNPVRNARLYLQSWRGSHTINANFQTDSSGNFRWNDAPADAVTFSVSAQNLRGVDNVSLLPDTDNVIKLGSPVHVRGTVTDAVTGNPIENFHLIFGIQFNNEQNINWQPQWNQDMGIKPGGKIDFTDDYSYPGIALRVEAQGYLPVDSRVIEADSGDATLDLKMKPGKDLIAIVRSPDGNPVAGATAILGIAGEGVFINNSRNVQNSGASQQTTGADGKIDFPPQSGSYKIVVLADAGYAEADQSALAKSQDIKLVPWGRIEGKMMIGSKPAAGQMVDVVQNEVRYDPQLPQIRNNISTTVGDDGRFVLDRVSPGSWSINRRIPFGNNGWSLVPLQTVEVSSGKTATVNVGGTGRPVVGKIIFPSGLAGDAGGYNIFEITTRENDAIFAQQPPVPDDIRNAPIEKQQAWMQQWIKSAAGKAFMEKMQKVQMNRRRYPFTVSSDGSFRIDDVLAGDYELSATLQTLDQTNQSRMIKPVAIGWANFTVSEMPTGRSDEPLQVDPVQMIKLAKYNVGDPISDLPLKSADKDIKFSDFRGKYLLLNFHQAANWSLPALNAIYDSFNPDKLTLLTINFDRNWMGRPSLSTAIRWQQATLVPNRSTLTILGTDFGISNQVPGDWLIDPDGKVAAADLHGAAVMAAITAALGPPTAPATQPTTAP